MTTIEKVRISSFQWWDSCFPTISKRKIMNIFSFGLTPCFSEPLSTPTMLPILWTKNPILYFHFKQMECLLFWSFYLSGHLFLHSSVQFTLSRPGIEKMANIATIVQVHIGPIWQKINPFFYGMNRNIIFFQILNRSIKKLQRWRDFTEIFSMVPNF